MKPLLIVSILLLSLTLLPHQADCAPHVGGKKGGKKPPSTAASSAAGGAAAGGAAAGVGGPSTASTSTASTATTTGNGAVAATRRASTLMNPTAASTNRQQTTHIVWQNNGRNSNANSLVSPSGTLANRLRSITGVIATPAGIPHPTRGPRPPICPARPVNRALQFNAPLPNQQLRPALPPLLGPAAPAQPVWHNWPVAIRHVDLPLQQLRLMIALPQLGQNQQAPLPPLPAQGQPGAQQQVPGAQLQPPIPAAVAAQGGHLPGVQQQLPLPAGGQPIPAPPLNGVPPAQGGVGGVQPGAQVPGGRPQQNANLSPQLHAAQAARRDAYLRIQAALQHEAAEAAEAEAAAAAAGDNVNPFMDGDDDAALRNARPALPTLDEQEAQRRVAANALFQQQQMAAANAAEDGGHVQDGDRGDGRAADLEEVEAARGGASQVNSEANVRSEVGYDVDMDDVLPQLNQRDADRRARNIHVHARIEREGQRREIPDRGRPDARQHFDGILPTFDMLVRRLRTIIGDAVNFGPTLDMRWIFRDVLRDLLWMDTGISSPRLVEIDQSYVRGDVLHAIDPPEAVLADVRGGGLPAYIISYSTTTDARGRNVLALRYQSLRLADSDRERGLTLRSGRIFLFYPVSYAELPFMTPDNHGFRNLRFVARIGNSALMTFFTRIFAEFGARTIEPDEDRLELFVYFGNAAPLIAAIILVHRANVGGIQIGCVNQ